MRRSPLYSYCLHFKSHIRPNWRCRQCVVMPWTRSDHYHSCGSMLWLRSDDHRLRIPIIDISKVIGTVGAAGLSSSLLAEAMDA